MLLRGAAEDRGDQPDGGAMADHHDIGAVGISQVRIAERIQYGHIAIQYGAPAVTPRHSDIEIAPVPPPVDLGEGLVSVVVASAFPFACLRFVDSLA